VALLPDCVPTTSVQRWPFLRTPPDPQTYTASSSMYQTRPEPQIVHCSEASSGHTLIRIIEFAECPLSVLESDKLYRGLVRMQHINVEHFLGLRVHVCRQRTRLGVDIRTPGLLSIAHVLYLLPKALVHRKRLMIIKILPWKLPSSCSH
jgi:hypothetical protein